MLVASNRAPIWHCAQSRGPFCGGADADVQTAEQTRRAFIENELSRLSRVVIAVNSQEVGQATNQSADVLRSVTRSRASRDVPRHRRGMSLLHQNKAADSLKRTRETSENELSTVPAPSLWCYVNQHDDWRCLRVNGRPRRLKRVMEVVFVTAAFHSAHHRRLRRWLQIIISVKWNLIK